MFVVTNVVELSALEFGDLIKVDEDYVMVTDVHQSSEFGEDYVIIEYLFIDAIRSLNDNDGGETEAHHRNVKIQTYVWES